MTKIGSLVLKLPTMIERKSILQRFDPVIDGIKGGAIPLKSRDYFRNIKFGELPEIRQLILDSQQFKKVIAIKKKHIHLNENSPTASKKKQIIRKLHFPIPSPQKIV